MLSAFLFAFARLIQNKKIHCYIIYRTKKTKGGYVMFETVSVIGGDLRQLTLARLLKDEGYHIFLYGFDKDIQLDNLELEPDKDFARSGEL